MSQTMNESVLQDLFETIVSRKGADAKSSYTASLFFKGEKKIAQKVGEEAVETVIAALAENKEKVIEESADLLYHLLVLWAQKSIEPNEVFEALRKREGVSGITEKNNRAKE